MALTPVGGELKGGREGEEEEVAGIGLELGASDSGRSSSSSSSISSSSSRGGRVVGRAAFAAGWEGGGRRSASENSVNWKKKIREGKRDSKSCNEKFVNKCKASKVHRQAPHIYI